MLFRTYCWSELVLPWAAKMPGRADGMRWNLRFQLDFRPMVNSQFFGHEHHWTSHFLEKNTASNSIFHHFPVFVGKNQISSHVCWFQPQAAAARLLSRMDAQVGCSREMGISYLNCDQWIGLSLREHLQENPIFNGEIFGFRLRFSLKATHW